MTPDRILAMGRVMSHRQIPVIHQLSAMRNRRRPATDAGRKRLIDRLARRRARRHRSLSLRCFDIRISLPGLSRFWRIRLRKVSAPRTVLVIRAVAGERRSGRHLGLGSRQLARSRR